MLAYVVTRTIVKSDGASAKLHLSVLAVCSTRELATAFVEAQGHSDTTQFQIHAKHWIDD